MTLRPETQRTVRLSPRVRFRAVADEGVLVHLESQRVVVVSEVGLEVVRQLAAGARTLSELAAELSSTFDVDLDQAQADIEVFLGQLQVEQAVLVEPSIAAEGDA